jgi:uncharacterized protein (DUF433 family)
MKMFYLTYPTLHYIILNRFGKRANIMFSRITINPEICHGKPVIKGTRVLVSNILASLAAGETADSIMKDYPNITGDDIQEALLFGSELSSFESHPYDIKVS